MKSRIALLIAAAASAAAMSAMPQPAAAQCRLCDAPTTAVDQGTTTAPIALDVEANLDFDRLILLGPGEGTATLLPDGSRNVTGVIGDMGVRAMVGSALVRGEAGRAVRIGLPRRIQLHSLGGAQIAIEDIVSDLPDAPRLDGAGTLTFRFGGRLRVSGDADGDYRGDVPITVEYL